MISGAIDRHDLHIGSWYTGYSAGFWQLIEIIPKYASFDYSGEGAKWNKGNLIGQWCILKKAFTSKMKKSLRVEFSDSAWLKPVSDETACLIEKLFRDDPAYKTKFELYSNTPPPLITNQWLTLSDSEEAALLRRIGLLPSRFTMEQFVSVTHIPKHCFCKPPASHLLSFCGYPWELTDGFDEIYFKADVTRTNGCLPGRSQA